MCRALPSAPVRMPCRAMVQLRSPWGDARATPEWPPCLSWPSCAGLTLSRSPSPGMGPNSVYILGITPRLIDDFQTSSPIPEVISPAVHEIVGFR